MLRGVPGRKRRDVRYSGTGDNIDGWRTHTPRRKARRMARKPPPVCKAILLCSEVLVEKNGMGTVRGIFDSLEAKSLPFSAPSFMVYLRLHNGIGAYNITAEIHDQETQGIIGKSAGKTCSFPDRQTVLNIRFRAPSLILRHGHAGSYDVVAFADENEIDRYRFTLNVL
jgi:hypothetical protein